MLITIPVPNKKGKIALKKEIFSIISPYIKIIITSIIVQHIFSVGIRVVGINIKQINDIQHAIYGKYGHIQRIKKNKINRNCDGK